MQQQPTIIHWLEIPEDCPIRFGDLSLLIATAIAPIHEHDDSVYSMMKQGGVRIEFDEELKMAVRRGALVVRDSLTLGKHTFTHGAALLNAVVLPSDLMHFFQQRGGIGIRWNTTPQSVEPLKAVQRSAAHRSTVLATLGKLGINPARLPQIPRGRPSPAKEAVRTALPKMSKAVLNTTWQDLLDSGEIVNS